jgi:hypothetical protein
MHPAILAKYGLRAEDAPFLEAWRNFAQANGLDFEDGLTWYRERWRPGMSDADAFADFMQYAGGQGWSDVQIEQAGQWHDTVALHGVEAIPAPKVNRGQDAETIARAEHLLKHDRKAYYSDETLQIEYQEALARQSGGAPAPSARTSSRRAEIESLIKDRRSDYYRSDERGEALQLEYKTILAGDQGSGSNQSPALSEGNS